MAEFSSAGPDDGACTLRVTGDLDIATVEQFRTEARTCLGSDAARLVLDFGGVTFIDSSGLGALVELRKDALAEGRTIELADVPRSVARVLAVTGLDELFLEADG